jgi:hypothetical protein
MGKYVRLVADGHTWIAFLDVPADVRPAFGGRKQLTKTTGTTDRKKAERIALRMVAQSRDQFDAAREGQPSALETRLQAVLMEGFGTAIARHEAAHLVSLRGIADHPLPTRSRLARDAVKEQVLAEPREELRTELTPEIADNPLRHLGSILMTDMTHSGPREKLINPTKPRSGRPSMPISMNSWPRRPGRKPRPATMPGRPSSHGSPRWSPSHRKASTRRMWPDG